MERFEALLQKFASPKVEIRGKAIKSVLLKLETGLIDQAILKQVAILDQILNCVALFLKAITTLNSNQQDDFSTGKSSDYKAVSDVLVILEFLVHADIIPSKKGKNCAKIVEQLYHLTTLSFVPEALVGNIKKIIDLINIVKIDSNENQETTLAASPPHTKPSDDLSPSNPSGFIRRGGSSGSGAGAIFLSRLATVGFKFPFIRLNEIDEKFLFDLEVKIRLRQDKVLKLVLDAVIDYPAPIFLQRPSLLQALFDVLSVPFSELDYEADPYGYHPIFVLEILDKLLDKCESSYQLYLDRSFCSPVVNHQKTEENDLAPIRYPVAANSTAMQEVADASAIPLPSYAGFVFACSAASLALCQTHHLFLQKAIHPIFLRAIKILFGLFHLVKHDLNEFNAFISRIQHLLHRFEAVIASLLTKTDDLFEFSSLWVLLNENIEALTYATLPERAVGLSVLQLLIHLQSQIPCDLYQGSKTGDSNCKLELPQGLQKLFRDLLLSIDSWKSFLSSQLELTLIKGMNQEILAEVKTIRKGSRACYLFTTQKVTNSNAHLLQAVMDLSKPVEIISAVVEQAECCIHLFESILGDRKESDRKRKQEILDLCRLPECLPLLLHFSLLSEDCDDALQLRVISLILRLLILPHSMLLRNRMIQALGDSLQQDKNTSADSEDRRNTSQSWLESKISQDIAALPSELLKSQEIVLLQELTRPEIFLTLAWNFLQISAASEASSYEEDEAHHSASIILELFSELISSLRNKILDSSSSVAFFVDSSWNETLRWLFGMSHSKFYLSLPEKFDGYRENIGYFLAKLEDACFDRDKSSYSHIILLSMFHLNSPIRVTGILEARKYLISSAVQSQNNAADLAERLKSADPFHGSFMQVQPFSFVSNVEVPVLESNLKMKSVSIKSQRFKKNKVAAAVKSEVFTHEDVDKLRRIFLSEDFPELTRSSALKQALDMLLHDPLLLKTCSKIWVITTLQQIMLMAQRILFARHSNQNQSLDPDQYSFVNIDSLTATRMEILIMLIAMVQLLFNAFPSEVLNIADFADIQDEVGQGQDKLSFGVFVALFTEHVDILQSCGMEKPLTGLKSRVTQKKALESSDELKAQFKKMIFLATQLLWNFICHEQYWDLSRSNSVFPSLFKRKDLESFSSFHVVDFLPTFMCRLSPAEKLELPLDQDLLNVFGIAQPDQNKWQRHSLTYTFVEEELNIAVNDLESCLLDVTFPNVENIQTVVATTLFELLVHAGNHNELNGAINVAHLFGQVLTHLDLEHVFLRLKISVFTAVSTMITSAPRTKQDRFSLFLLLQYFNHYISQLPKDEGNEEVLDALQQLVECLATLILPLLQTATSSSGSGKDEEISNYCYQSNFLQLLSLISSFSSSNLMMLDLLFLQTHVIDYVFLEKFITEDDVTAPIFTSNSSTIVVHCRYFRFLASSIMQNLLTHHRGINLVQSLEERKYKQLHTAITVSDATEDRITTKNRILNICLKPLYRIIQVCKLMRAVDVFRDSMIVISSLKILLIYLQKECQDRYVSRENHLYLEFFQELSMWQWLIRLLYDHRNEVRFLVMSIIQLLIPLFVAPSQSKLDENDENHSPEAKDEEFRQFDFPPVEQLSYLFYDEKEAPLVRLKALQIILQYNHRVQLTTSLSAHLLNKLPMFPISTSRVLQQMTHLLQMTATQNHSYYPKVTEKQEENIGEGFGLAVSMNGMILMVDCISLMLQTSRQVQEKSFNDSAPSADDMNTFLAHCSQAKVFPLLIQFLDPTLQQQLFINRHFSGFSSTKISGTSSLTYHINHKFCQEMHQMKKIFNFKFCQLLLLVKSSDSDSESSNSQMKQSHQASFYEDCLKHTNLVSSLLTSLSAMLTGDGALDSMDDISRILSHDFIEIRYFSAVVTIFLTMVQFMSMTSNEIKTIAVGSSVLQQLLLQRPDSFLQLLSCINRFLATLNGCVDYFFCSEIRRDDLQARLLMKEREKVALCLEKILHFLSLITSLSIALQVISYDATSGIILSSEYQEIIVGIFVEVTLLRIQLQALGSSSSDILRLSELTDFAISLLLNRFVVCQKIFKMMLFSEKYRTLQLGTSGGRKIDNHLWQSYRSSFLAVHNFTTEDELTPSDQQIKNPPRKSDLSPSKTVEEEVDDIDFHETVDSKATTIPRVHKVAPPRVSITTTTTASTATKGLMRSKWRQKARSYSWKENRSSTPSKSKGELPVSLKNSVFFSLLLFRNCLFEMMSVLSETEIESFCRLLATLVKENVSQGLAAALIASSSPSISQSVSSYHEELRGLTSTTSFKPSNPQLFALLLTTLIHLVRESVIFSQNQAQSTSPTSSTLARIREFIFKVFDDGAKAALIETGSESSRNTGLLHFLMSIGTGNGFQSPVRHMSLQFLSFLLRCNHIGVHIIFPPASRISLSHILAIEIQTLLNSSQTEPATAEKLVFFYFFTLTSFMLSPSLPSKGKGPAQQGKDGVGKGQGLGMSCYQTQLCEKNFTLSNYNNLYTLQSHSNKLHNNNMTKKTLKQLSVLPNKNNHHSQTNQQNLLRAVDSMNLLPFNDLFVWIEQKFAYNSELMTLLNTFLLQLFILYYYQNNHHEKTIDGITSMEKTILNMCSSENVFQALLSLCVSSNKLFSNNASQNSAAGAITPVQSISRLTLKVLFHANEKLKSTIKQQISMHPKAPSFDFLY